MYVHDFVFLVVSQEKFVEIREEMERLFRLYNMTLKHMISDTSHGPKLARRIKEGKEVGSLEPGMEILLGLRLYLVQDTIIPNSYLNLHPKKRVAATGPILDEDKFLKNILMRRHIARVIH